MASMNNESPTDFKNSNPPLPYNHSALRTQHSALTQKRPAQFLNGAFSALAVVHSLRGETAATAAGNRLDDGD